MAAKGESMLPDGWEVVPLGSIIADLKSGVSVNSDARPARDGEVGILKISAVSEGRFLPQENQAGGPSPRSWPECAIARQLDAFDRLHPRKEWLDAVAV